MPLAGDHDDITWLRKRDGTLDRAATIGLDFLVPIGAGLNFSDDRQRVLAARIVRRDDRVISQRTGSGLPLATAAQGLGAQLPEQEASLL